MSQSMNLQRPLKNQKALATSASSGIGEAWVDVVLNDIAGVRCFRLGRTDDFLR